MQRRGGVRGKSASLQTIRIRCADGQGGARGLLWKCPQWSNRSQRSAVPLTGSHCPSLCAMPCAVQCAAWCSDVDGNVRFVCFRLGSDTGGRRHRLRVCILFVRGFCGRHGRILVVEKHCARTKREERAHAVSCAAMCVRGESRRSARCRSVPRFESAATARRSCVASQQTLCSSVRCAERTLRFSCALLARG